MRPILLLFTIISSEICLSNMKTVYRAQLAGKSRQFPAFVTVLKIYVMTKIMVMFHLISHTNFLIQGRQILLTYFNPSSSLKLVKVKIQTNQDYLDLSQFKNLRRLEIHGNLTDVRIKKNVRLSFLSLQSVSNVAGVVTQKKLRNLRNIESG